MTEPIRPPSLRHNERRARHRSPSAGGWAHARDLGKRERQPLTQSSSLPANARRRDCYPGGDAPVPRYPGWLIGRRLPQGTPSRPLGKHDWHRQRPGPAATAHRPSDVRYQRKRQAVPKRSSWVLRAVPVSRAQQPVRALRRYRRRPPAGTGWPLARGPGKNDRPVWLPARRSEPADRRSS